jgi:error-prone DNA polymerase
MPDIPYKKFKFSAKSPSESSEPPLFANQSEEYAELEVTSNFSFLRGGSHPEELVGRAAELGYRALAVTDHETLAGIVRAHTAARDLPLQYIVGSRLFFSFASSLNRSSALYRFSLLAYPLSRQGYGNLCALLTKGKRRAQKGSCELLLEDFFSLHHDLAITLCPPFPEGPHTQARDVAFLDFCTLIKDSCPDPRLISVALSRDYSHLSRRHSENVIKLSHYLGIPLVATGNIFYHVPERRPLQDILTCIREKCTIHAAGFRLLQNAERYLKAPQEIARLFRDLPHALSRTLEIASWCTGFSLDQLRYEYPKEVCPPGRSAAEYLRELVFQGAHTRYREGLPEKVLHILEEELRLIGELAYEKYFLTCYHIVQFARSRGILCQGRGAAANSAVCFCLGITSVDPERINLLFARFISKERNEPPDIDIDFEHERREEVIQYIYETFGRERAGLTCEVITYRYRSAVKEVGKALGLPPRIVEGLSKAVHRWTNHEIDPEDLKELGLNPESVTVKNTFSLAKELLGFPRHLSQHVGGFIISEHPLSEIVPIGNAGMESRTIIEWDKDDIESLGMLKIDILALGMLTCIRKALSFINRRLLKERSPLYPLELHSIPAEDPAVYDMICKADTVGVFQIESRAQMSMLPRLKPRCFYDLVIEVAIVRPGPIQGNMVHPYLKRRSGLETITFPDERVAEILGKTLGVPLFQEQAMRLAIVLAKFTPGEAELLRRAMAAWKRDKGVIATFKKRIVEGMTANGYSEQFAEHCMNQIKGFSEYGFPESHAASFALLVYASAWIKHYFPAEFTTALLNSLPMGFYAPSQLVRDAEQHHVPILPIDVAHSEWLSTVEQQGTLPSVRLGMHLVKGVGEEQALLIREAQQSYGKASSVHDLWRKAHLHSRSFLKENAPYKDAPPRSLRRGTLELLAQADAFRSLSLGQREALWEIKALAPSPADVAELEREPTHHETSCSYAPGLQVTLPFMSPQKSMFEDYRMTGLSLKAHPLQFVRESLAKRGVATAAALRVRPLTTRSRYEEESLVSVAGIAIVRQRPSTAKGVVFVTLEDETGIANLIIRRETFERFQRIIISSAALLARGTLDRVGEVIYVSASYIESLDAQVLISKDPNLPSLSYSY